MSYYKVLNLEETAKEEDIKKAYRQKALEYHPDKTTYEIEEAREKFRELDEAYKVLSNDDRRALYDVYHRHKEEIEKNSFLNPRIINLINKMYIEQEQEQQKQSVVNDVMLDSMPSIDIDLLLKIYDQRYHKNQKYYQQQARKICQFLEQKSQDDSSNEGDSSLLDYQSVNKQGNQLDRDFMIAQETRGKEDNSETNTIEQFLKKIEEQQGKKNLFNSVPGQIQSDKRKEANRLSSNGKNDSKASQTFVGPFANFEEFHQKYFDLINSFAEKEDKGLRNSHSIQRYADCYDFGTATIPLLSLDKSQNTGNKQQQQLTKKQIKHIWELTQQKKVKQRIHKKKPVFILKKQLKKERKPIKLAELQQKIAEIQSQIQQQKQHYQKCRNRKEPIAPSILEISKQKYLELVQRKKMLTEQSFSLQRDDEHTEDAQPNKYGPSCEQYYNQLKADLNSSESQDNCISDKQESQNNNNNSFEDEDDISLLWNGQQQEGENEEIDNWIHNNNDNLTDQQVGDDSLEENVTISPQQEIQLDKIEQPEQEDEDISNLNSKQDLDLSLQKDNYQQQQYLWQDQPLYERPSFNNQNEMKSILSQQQQQEYQLQQKQKLRPNTVENSFVIPLKDSPFQIQENLPESVQGSPFREQNYQDNYDLNYVPSFLHQNSYQDQIFSPSLFDSQLAPTYQDNLKDLHEPIPSFPDQL